MPTLRDTLRPLLMIGMASAIIIILLAQLDATAWAAGIRLGATGELETFATTGPGGILALIGPLLKVALVMGIPALITTGARRAMGRLTT